jgi:uncharacterized protein Usg
MRRRDFIAGLAGSAAWPVVAPAQPAPPPDPQRPANAPGELVNAGHRFFGGVSGGLASVIEHAVSKWGLPNGYVLGEEAGGAFFGGRRYGEGMLYAKNAGDLRVFWQGPSVDGLTTANILYRRPDHPWLLQTYVWQAYDLCPTFPELQRFLDFRRASLEGDLHSVMVAHSNMIKPAELRAVDGIFRLH